MCEYCGMSICPGNCPNANEPEPIGICPLCGEEIFVGDSVLVSNDIERIAVHMECVNESSAYEIGEALGLEITDAEEGDLFAF